MPKQSVAFTGDLNLVLTWENEGGARSPTCTVQYNPEERRRDPHHESCLKDLMEKKILLMTMEPEQPINSVAVNKPSGIPRPRQSKLPVLSSKASTNSLAKQQQVVEPVNHVASKLQNPPSISSFSRPGQLGSKSLVTKTNSSKNNVPNGTKHVPITSRAPTDPRTLVVRPLSRANRPEPPQATAKATTYTEDEEHQHHQLSSTDSLRSPARQGFYDDPHDEAQESIGPPEVLYMSNEHKRSRPSLSDRTMESIQALPSTPKERRRSSFFSPVESPMGPPPRPTSSSSRNRSNPSSRPGTSDGSFARPSARTSSAAKKAPASIKPASRTSFGGLGFTPSSANRRSVNNTFTSKVQCSEHSVPASPKPPSPERQTVPGALPRVQRGVQAGPAKNTVAAKSKNPRPEISDDSGPALEDGALQTGQTFAQSSASRAAKDTAFSPSNASSAALRQQIAAAKAAARKEKAKHDSVQDVAAGGNSFAGDLHADPFNQAPKDEKHILRNRINTARMDGKLNIAALGLKQIPDEVMKMYSAESMEESKVNWAEVVDLTRLIAADNEIAELSDTVFLDTSAEEFEADDQTESNQFGGLEVLDLHRNKLSTIPIGMRRLERLTRLNLAYNKLENSTLEVISQISSLRELKLGHNILSGTLPSSICVLRNLETLDLQANRLLGLPEALRELVGLKVLNVSLNQFTTLPMEALRAIHLSELDASDNALIGSLFPQGGTSGHPTLQTLKVTNNSVAALTFSETLELPQLRTLDVTNNHLTVLPPVEGWPELITLTAGDNKIKELPSGFSTLRKLRNANLTSNELRLLDPEIARMENLESLVLASNPLRDKKFLNMSAADIKRDLRARLEPTETEDRISPDHEAYEDARDGISPSPSSPTSSWSLKPQGALDLTGRGYSDGINESLGSFLKSNEVRQLLMQSNLLTAVPPALWLGPDLRVLDLSGNAFASDYLSDDLALPTLQDLNLCRCGLQALQPLMMHLQAPQLRSLQITANRLTGALPGLRESFPLLTTLLASDNKFASVTADSLRGMHAVNLASNNIEQLPSEIGLLWDEGLRSLEIGSNAFRVPNYRILEKGTEATLRWLRDRLPAP